MQRHLRRFLLALLVGVAVYGAFVAYTGHRAIGGSLASFRWSAFAAALGLATLNYVLRWLKWEYYLGRLEVRHVPKLDSALVFLSGFVLTITPGKVGEVFKSAVLAETHGVPVARTAPIVVAERLTDVIGVIALIVVGSVGFQGGLGWAAAGTACVVAGMTVIVWRAPGEWLIARLERRSGRAAALAPRLREAFDSMRILASPAALLYPTLLSVLGWGGEGLALALLLEGFGTPSPIPLAMFFYATATLAGAIVPVPGGLGVAEAMIQEQLVRLGGVPAAPATAAMILIRFATLWWAVIVGFAALGVLRVRFPHLLRGSPEAPTPA
ncbi:MAG: flippase-like domain-containing protein [Polyangiaceae bacterium]|nr:flippase-like domain-containing protein [Polyangiaceae bacterium]